jgi:hypothetical protein
MPKLKRQKHPSRIDGLQNKPITLPLSSTSISLRCGRTMWDGISKLCCMQVNLRLTSAHLTGSMWLIGHHLSISWTPCRTVTRPRGMRLLHGPPSGAAGQSFPWRPKDVSKETTVDFFALQWIQQWWWMTLPEFRQSKQRFQQTVSCYSCLLLTWLLPNVNYSSVLI